MSYLSDHTKKELVQRIKGYYPNAYALEIMTRARRLGYRISTDQIRGFFTSTTVRITDDRANAISDVCTDILNEREPGLFMGVGMGQD